MCRSKHKPSLHGNHAPSAQEAPCILHYGLAVSSTCLALLRLSLQQETILVHMPRELVRVVVLVGRSGCISIVMNRQTPKAWLCVSHELVHFTSLHVAPISACIQRGTLAPTEKNISMVTNWCETLMHTSCGFFEELRHACHAAMQPEVVQCMFFKHCAKHTCI